MDRRLFLKSCFAGLAGATTLGSMVYGKQNAKKPNILLIMADDI